MHFVVFGTSLHTTQMSNMDRYFFDEGRQISFRDQLKNVLPESECILLQTCNRLEIYIASETLIQDQIYSALAQTLCVEIQEIQLNFLRKDSEECFRHLMLVVSSLDSVIVGESQILSQVKEALLSAQKGGFVAKYLQRLFEIAVKAGKRVRAETTISKGAVSISQAAVELGKRFFGSYRDIKILVLGAGEMGSLALKHLISSGAKDIYVANRTYHRAKELANDYSCESIPLEEVDFLLREVDLVISAINYDGYFLSSEKVVTLMEKRRYSSLFAIDISLPRTLDPALNDLEQFFLFDIEDLKEVVDRNLKERLSSRSQVEAIIEEELQEFKSWLEKIKLVPTLQNLERYKHQIIDLEAQSAMNKLQSGKNPEEVLERLAGNLSNKYMHLIYRLLSEIPNSDLQRHEIQKMVQELVNKNEVGQISSSKKEKKSSTNV